MSPSFCPGQDRRFWTPEDIQLVPCPSCGTGVELFKDEGRRKCPECGFTVNNPKVLQSCARWCEHAEACIGGGTGNNETGNVSSSLINFLTKEGNCSGPEVMLLAKSDLLADRTGINSIFSQGAIKITFLLNCYLSLEKPGPLGFHIQALGDIIPDTLYGEIRRFAEEYTGPWPAAPPDKGHLTDLLQKEHPETALRAFISDLADYPG